MALFLTSLINLECHSLIILDCHSLISLDCHSLISLDCHSLIRSEERRVGKSVDLGGRRIIKKKINSRNPSLQQ